MGNALWDLLLLVLGFFYVPDIARWFHEYPTPVELITLALIFVPSIITIRRRSSDKSSHFFATLAAVLSGAAFLAVGTAAGIRWSIAHQYATWGNAGLLLASLTVVVWPVGWRIAVQTPQQEKAPASFELVRTRVAAWAVGVRVVLLAGLAVAGVGWWLDGDAGRWLRSIHLSAIDPWTAVAIGLPALGMAIAVWGTTRNRRGHRIGAILGTGALVLLAVGAVYLIVRGILGGYRLDRAMSPHDRGWSAAVLAAVVLVVWPIGWPVEQPAPEPAPGQAPPDPAAPRPLGVSTLGAWAIGLRIVGLVGLAALGFGWFQRGEAVRGLRSLDAGLVTHHIVLAIGVGLGLVALAFGLINSRKESRANRLIVTFGCLVAALLAWGLVYLISLFF